MDRAQALAQAVQLTRLIERTTEHERANAMDRLRRLRAEHNISHVDIARRLDAEEKPKNDEGLGIFTGLLEGFSKRKKPFYYEYIKPLLAEIKENLEAALRDIEAMAGDEATAAYVQLYLDCRHMVEGTGDKASPFLGYLDLKFHRDQAVRICFKALEQAERERLEGTGVRVYRNVHDSSTSYIEHLPESLDLSAWWHALHETVQKTGLTKRSVLAVVGDRESFLQSKVAQAKKKRDEKEEAGSE